MDELTPAALAAVLDEPQVDLLAAVLRARGPVPGGKPARHCHAHGRHTP